MVQAFIVKTPVFMDDIVGTGIYFACVCFKALQHDIMLEAERLSSVLVRGRHLLDQAQLVSDDVSTTVELLDSVDRRWTSLRQTAGDVSARLKDVLPVSNSFHHGLTTLMAWIDLAEDRCVWLSGGVRSANDVAQQLNAVQSLAADVERQRCNVDEVTSAGCRLMELVDADRGGVEQQMNDIENRWTTLSQRTYCLSVCSKSL